MVNFLLTGSNGFLGKVFLKVLNEKSFKTLSRISSDYNLDISNQIPEFKDKFEVVIHAAGKAHSIDYTKEQSIEFYNVNVLGTINLLEGLIKSNLPKQFIFISTVSVYGLIEGENINEESPLIAVDPYGKSKIEAESIIRKWCENHNIVCTILRLPLVVSANPPGNLRSMINAIRNNFYFNISDGVARKSMVLASDVAKFILKAAEVGGTYNLTDGFHPNFNELSNCIALQMGKKLVPNMPLFFANILAFIGDVVGQKFPINSNKLNKITSTLTFDDKKARLAFGWNPSPVLKGFNIHE